jgi:hypothetical protein
MVTFNEVMKVYKKSLFSPSSPRQATDIILAFLELPNKLAF